nr:hypothetical protein [Nonomuraea terrae]
MVGLYLAPPAHAAVFAVDDKPRIQASQRSAPVLPMLPGVPQRRNFDYVRHGTVDLFAALNTATGKVIGKLAGPSALHASLHPGLLFLDQPGRALVRRVGTALPGARRLLLPGRAQNRAGRVDQDLERRRQAVHLDQDR